MTKKKAVAVAVIATVIGFALFAHYDMQEARRIHAENLLKAEEFKREFDRDVKLGTRLEAVEEYLRTKPVQTQRSFTSNDGRTTVDALRIQVVNERSPVWGCGRYSVGIIAKITKDRLESARVSEWSFDCV